MCTVDCTVPVNVRQSEVDDNEAEVVWRLQLLEGLQTRVECQGSLSEAGDGHCCCLPADEVMVDDLTRGIR